MKQRVLIIDDDAAIRSLLQAHLVDEAVELLCASDGDDGLEKARRLKPDLILLDVHMPRMNGFEVCRRLKAEMATHLIPVLFLTGSCSPEHASQALDLGAADFVQKPFDRAELKARVRAHLRTKELLDLLERRAQVDGLTGLWNRAYFEHRLNEERAIRSRRPSPLSCVFADIDHFKSLNDDFGHPFGDRVLRQIARVLAGGSRTEDSTCRYGGEEFVILVPGVEVREAAVMAERLRAEIAELEFVHNGLTVNVTCSLGVADCDGSDCDSLVARADAALYEAKHGGRNRVQIAGPASTQPPCATFASTGGAAEA